jgi:hypothetical protein
MISAAVALGAFILHAATAWRYGYFRDELYFIACGRHLAWGYVDQPPLVALVAWAAQPFGDSLLALRLPVVLASALTVFSGVRIVRELGGGRFAQTLGGAAIALTPAYLALGNILTTTSFEPLAWTLVVWCGIRLVRGPARLSTWIALALAAAFGLYGKYSMALLLGATIVGLLLTPQRRILKTPWFAVATVIVLVAMAPNLWWQAAHGWPFFAVLAGDEHHRLAFNNGWQLESYDILANAREFALEQLLYTGPFGTALWVTGAIAPIAWTRMRDLRWISIAYVVLLAAAVVLGAKGYYIIGIYAVLLCIGALAAERAAVWLRTALAAGVIVTGVAFAPLSLPVLGIGALISYTQALGLTGTHGAPAHLIQPLFAEEFGWRRLAHDVAGAYDALPTGTREKTAIYADTYADAGAIDFFGRQFGLPDAIGTQNTYYLWGPRDYDGETLIAIGATRIDVLRKYYERCDLVGTSNEPLKWVVEGPSPIYLCTGPAMPLDDMWPQLKWYGA